MERAVFLDRDGVINEEIDLLNKKDQIRLIDGADKAIRLFNNLGLKVIVVTNQPQVARELCKEDDVKEINKEIVKRLEDMGAHIDAFYFCPHHPETHHKEARNPVYRRVCSCRKPGIGLFLQASNEHDIDLSRSFMVCDRTVDVKAGIDAGCKTILVRTGYGGRDGKYDVEADYRADNLYEAALVIEKRVNMMGIILAGGLGERLRPLTNDIPKPMLPVGGKPIVEYQVEMLKSVGIRDIVICGAYLIENIRDYFGDGSKFGVKISYIKDEMLGTGGALKNVEKLVDGSFVVLYGDIFIKMNLEEMMHFHRKNNAMVSIVVHETDHPQDSDLVEMNGDKIEKFLGKPKGDPMSNISKSSVYIMGPGVFKFFKDGRHSFESDVLPTLIEKGVVYGYNTGELIMDIGSKERYDEINERFYGKLENIAKRIRRHVIDMTSGVGSGHPGGSLSCVDILAALFFNKMRYNVKDPDWGDRDRFVLSKGHAAPALYATLAEAGFFSVNELKNLRRVDSILQGHPWIRTPGVEICSGSLGQGLSVANGMALAGKIDKKDYHVYVIIGDGESQEGQIWEAGMTAAHYKLNNLTAILDRNGLQIDGKTEDVMGLEPLADKWRAFGWDVIEINGHNFEELINAFNKKSNRPKMIIAYTIKGKGVSFMEHNVDFHGVVPTKEEVEKAMKELD